MFQYMGPEVYFFPEDIVQEMPKIIVLIKPKKNVFRSIHTNNWANFMEFIRYQNETLQNY